MNEEIAKQIIDLQNLSSLWSITSSIASIILAIVAIVLAIYFYTQTKKTEKDVSMSLSKIEAQSQALERITGNQVERLTKHITERNSLDISQPKIEEMLKNMTRESLNSNKQDNNNERINIVKYMIGTFHYCTISNYYAFMSLPPIEKFDETNNFHKRTKEMLDLTFNDVKFIKNQFELLKVTEDEIKISGLENLYNDTVNTWEGLVKDSSGAFIQIEQYKTNEETQS